MISAGPDGQSKLIDGKPQAIASSKAFGKPSNLEERTNRSDCFKTKTGSGSHPASKTRPSRPFSAINFLSDARAGPSPRILTDHCGCRSAIREKASIKRSNPFCRTSRPMATIQCSRVGSDDVSGRTENDELFGGA